MKYPRDFGQQEITGHSAAAEAVFWAAVVFWVVVFVVTAV